jgi:DNA-directed RNA polymerase subunit beta
MSVNLNKSSYSTTEWRRPRLNLGKNYDFMKMPDPLKMQKDSYKDFIDNGLESALKSIFPITNNSKSIQIDYAGFELTDPLFDKNECKLRGLTYAYILRIKVRMIVFDKEDDGDNDDKIKDIKDQLIYMGEIPVMTETGSFIVNGTERIVVSQLHRSPGVFFEHDKGRAHASNKLLYSARIIPYRGAWIDFEFDTKDTIATRIDKRRKLPVTVILRALGLNVESILSEFYEMDSVSVVKNKFALKLIPARLRGSISHFDIKDKSNNTIVETGRRVTQKHVMTLEKEKIDTLDVNQAFLFDKIIAHDIVDSVTGEVLINANTRITEEILETLLTNKVKDFKVLYINELEH